MAVDSVDTGAGKAEASAAHTVGSGRKTPGKAPGRIKIPTFGPKNPDPRLNEDLLARLNPSGIPRTPEDEQRVSRFLDALGKPLPEPTPPSETTVTPQKQQTSKPTYMPRPRTPAEIDELLRSPAARTVIEKPAKQQTPFADRRRLAQAPPEEVLREVPLETTKPGESNQPVTTHEVTPPEPKVITPERFAQATRSASEAVAQMRQKKK